MENILVTTRAVTVASTLILLIILTRERKMFWLWQSAIIRMTDSKYLPCRPADSTSMEEYTGM